MNEYACVSYMHEKYDDCSSEWVMITIVTASYVYTFMMISIYSSGYIACSTCLSFFTNVIDALRVLVS